MRKEPLIFNPEKIIDKDNIKHLIFGLEVIEPFGMFVVHDYACYTSESLWKNKKYNLPNYFLFKELNILLIKNSSDGESISYTTLLEFIEAMSEEERAQFYLNLPELTELLRL